jgi:hypothetical protein
MTELEKMKYAKSFIDHLAHGFNPVDGTSIPEDSVISNERISRCLLYVSELLMRNIDQEEKRESRVTKTQREPFAVTPEQLESFEYSKTPISATVLTQRLNKLIDQDKMRRLSYSHIHQWLLNIGMLEYRQVEGLKKQKRFPTQEGLDVGLVLHFWTKRNGTRAPMVFYSEAAQRFILDHIEAVSATEIKKKKHAYGKYTTVIDSVDFDEAAQPEEI